MYFADMAVCLWRIMFLGKNREIYNVGSDKRITILNLARLVKKIVPQTKDIEIKKNYPNNITTYIPNTDKVKKKLKFKSKFSIKKSIKKTYLSIIKNKDYYKL